MLQKSENPPEAQDAQSAGARVKHLKAAELGKELNVSRRTVLNWYELGIIPATIAVGRVLRFDIDECRAALKEHARK